MEHSEDISEWFRKEFSQITSKEDLLRLLNEAKSVVYGSNTKPIPLKSLTYYANPSVCKKRYSEFEINKKSGKKRSIHAPAGGLKVILKSLNYILQQVYIPNEVATGFVPQKSIVDNARMHLDSHYVYNIDLKDFFHSFDRNAVKLGFMRAPFSLNGSKEPLAFLLACLCTHPIRLDDSIKVVLPQGAPSSPTITNILCATLDRRLHGLAKRFGATYSRYADDITFSSKHNIYRNQEFLDELHRIIEDNQNLNINPEKTRLQKLAHRQEVTGLIVNSKVNVKRRYVKQVRMWLYYWERYGYEKAQQLFLKDYIPDKGHLKKGRPSMSNVIEGKLLFLKMVKGNDDSVYQKLSARFDKLILQIEDNHISSPLMDEVIDTIIGKDLTKGIELYRRMKSENDDK